MMIHFDTKNGKFNYRVAGILYHEDRVLLHRLISDDFWTLPGGRCEFGEFSHDTIVREWKEELDADVRVEGFHSISESTFTYRDTPYHEIQLIYILKLIEPKEELLIHSFSKIDEGNVIQFRWMNKDELEDEQIYPSNLIDILFEVEGLPKKIFHSQ